MSPNERQELLKYDLMILSGEGDEKVECCECHKPVAKKDAVFFHNRYHCAPCFFKDSP